MEYTFQDFIAYKEKKEANRVRARIIKEYRNHGHKNTDKRRLRKYEASEEYRLKYEAYMDEIREKLSDLYSDDALERYADEYAQFVAKMNAKNTDDNYIKSLVEKYFNGKPDKSIMLYIADLLRNHTDLAISKNGIIDYSCTIGWINYHQIPREFDEAFYNFFETHYNVNTVKGLCLRMHSQASILELVKENMCDYILSREEFDKKKYHHYSALLKVELAKLVTKSYMKSTIWPLLFVNYPYGRFVEKLKDNKTYRHVANILSDKLFKSEQLSNLIIKTIPERFVDLYPLARKMKRHFILHVGGTNSGKTYQGIEALKKAEYGIYLAPLRLLAHEVFNTINMAGVPCNMITGEEEILIPNAHHQSSTIEMLSLDEHYDVAVIDEAQMISDASRGGAWSEAIAGVLAEEIHVCMSPDALNLVIAIINECEDTFEIVNHERSTELVMDENPFEFPNDVQDGDALIVFSKRNVLSVAAELQRNKIKCSVIYGALPYEVRENEVKKFNEGETTVVVATDAIGMGMNLPIKRVVFLEIEKFDGEQRRLLNASEIKQIAGRAGRRGIYDVGYWNASFSKKNIGRLLNGNLPDLTEAYIEFPKVLLGIDGLITDTMDKWANLANTPPYIQADISELAHLCKVAEKKLEDKELIYKLACIPFNISNSFLFNEWSHIVDCVAKGEVAMPEEPFIPSEVNSKHLDELEDIVSYCDLYSYYLMRVENKNDVEFIKKWKNEAIDRIQNILKSQKLKRRQCNRCGSYLPWNFPYKICEKCYYAGSYY